MSQENVDVVRRTWEAFRAGMEHGEFDAWLDSEDIVDDFEWKQVHGVVEPGSHVGSDANRALRSIFEVYEDLRVEAEEYVDAGDTIVVVARAHGTARGSGLHMDQRLAFVWTVREGKPVQMEQYPNREDALKAVGLAE